MYMYMYMYTTVPPFAATPAKRRLLIVAADTARTCTFAVIMRAA